MSGDPPGHPAAAASSPVARKREPAGTRDGDSAAPPPLAHCYNLAAGLPSFLPTFLRMQLLPPFLIPPPRPTRPPMPTTPAPSLLYGPTPPPPQSPRRAGPGCWPHASRLACVRAWRLLSAPPPFRCFLPKLGGESLFYHAGVHWIPPFLHVHHNCFGSVRGCIKPSPKALSPGTPHPPTWLYQIPKVCAKNRVKASKLSLSLSVLAEATRLILLWCAYKNLLRRF